jgi:hypothetical protein
VGQEEKLFVDPKDIRQIKFAKKEVLKTGCVSLWELFLSITYTILFWIKLIFGVNYLF